MTLNEFPGRFIPTLIADGHTQMAIDSMLLEQDFSQPLLRFYRWNGPWLSLGRNQRKWPKHWESLSNKRKISIVRRPSGGQAVLHSGGLTYALIWPNPPRKRREAYQMSCQWLIDGFKSLGVSLRFGISPYNPKEKNCFNFSTAADLVDENGFKRVGSAQRWRQGRLLQHGEILLDPPKQLWREIFLTDAPQPAPKCIPREGLDIKLSRLIGEWTETQLIYKSDQNLARFKSESLVG